MAVIVDRVVSEVVAEPEPVLPAAGPRRTGRRWRALQRAGLWKRRGAPRRRGSMTEPLLYRDGPRSSRSTVKSAANSPATCSGWRCEDDRRAEDPAARLVAQAGRATEAEGLLLPGRAGARFRQVARRLPRSAAEPARTSLQGAAVSALEVSLAGRTGREVVSRRGHADGPADDPAVPKTYED